MGDSILPLDSLPNYPSIFNLLQQLAHLSLPWKVSGGWNAILDILGFIMMGIDKSNAQSGEWRISEKTLLVTALVGGWGGIALGMRGFHHKTSKMYFVGIVALAAFAWLTFFKWLYTVVPP